MPLRIAIVVLLLCAVAPLLAAGNWVAHPVMGVNVYTREGQEGLASQVSGMVSVELPRVAEAVGQTSVRAFDIYAYDDGVAFLRDAGKNPFLRGVSYRPGGTIRLKPAVPEELQRTLAHELAHSLLDQRLENSPVFLPLWVEEGIAGHLSEPLTDAQRRGVSHMIHRDGVLTLEQLGAAFSSDGSRDAAYLQSRAMVAWLEDQHPGALHRLLAAMAAGRSFDDAIVDATGLTVERWWRSWQSDVPGLLLLLNLLASPVVYAPLAVLVVIVATVRALRKRDDEEEAEEDGEEADAADAPETPDADAGDAEDAEDAADAEEAPEEDVMLEDVEADDEAPPADPPGRT